jgi:hypothetical protein
VYSRVLWGFVICSGFLENSIFYLSVLQVLAASSFRGETLGARTVCRGRTKVSVGPKVETFPRPRKYYAIRRGYQVGIFDNWPECERQVSRFSRAEFKSFKSWEEAEQYMYCRVS